MTVASLFNMRPMHVPHSFLIILAVTVKHSLKLNVPLFGEGLNIGSYLSSYDQAVQFNIQSSCPGRQAAQA